jgi:hypothetical protein
MPALRGGCCFSLPDSVSERLYQGHRRRAADHEHRQPVAPAFRGRHSGQQTCSVAFRFGAALHAASDWPRLFRPPLRCTALRIASCPAFSPAPGFRQPLPMQASLPTRDGRRRGGDNRCQDNQPPGQDILLEAEVRGGPHLLGFHWSAAQ